jgi:uncharacterized protein (DUF1501 family)
MTMRDLLLGRRAFLRESALGLGTLALATLLPSRLSAGDEARDLADPLAPRRPPLPAKATNVIFLFMAGAPSQLDLFDHKPKLNELNHQPIPESFTKGERFAFIKGTPRLLGSPFAFARHGAAGHEMSELLPHLAGVADELAIVRSMHTDQFNHGPGQVLMNCGSALFGRPSMGSWATYGLGSENRNLPGFVVMLSGKNAPDGGTSCWANGFLPSYYQGVQFRPTGDPVLALGDPAGMSGDDRRASLDALRALNQHRLDAMHDPEIATRIASYELAFRMQSSVPELADIAKEPAEVHRLYGTTPGKTSFANNCLMARRLVERGVRFVQLYHRGWDQHGADKNNSIDHELPVMCRDVDQAAAALIADLKRRGLLDHTLVVWGGEFGRTPMNEGRNGVPFLGRDHHPHAFTMWLAGGGIKRGVAIGATDELGYRPTADPVSVHDLHATMLHLLGFDHTKLTYRFQGRDFRLTDVEGEVVAKLLA